MSILSDRTIRKLCLTPTKIFNQKAYDEFVAEKNRLGWGGSISVKNIPHILEMQRERLTRDATQEEIDAFVPMISPFEPHLIREADRRLTEFPYGTDVCPQLVRSKIISMGTTSYGYDVSLTDDVKIFTNTNALEIDPKRFDEKKCLVDAEIYTDEDGGRFVRIPPHSYMLGATREYFRIPRDIMVVCLGKSTYARSGVLVNTTPIEPGFEGNVVIEIANTTPLPARIYLGEGVAQFLFLRGDEPCETSYGDRGGKYQGQTGVTLPTV